MKQGINYSMPVSFDIDLDTVESIEFVFEQYNRANERTLKSAIWINGNENEFAKRVTIGTDPNVILIKWLQDETYQFQRNQNFFLDTRIHLIGSVDNPITPIISLEMHPTLFS